MSTAKRRSTRTTPPAPASTHAALSVPGSKPRNRVATNELLRKSGAHLADDGKGGKRKTQAAMQLLKDELSSINSRARTRDTANDHD